ncbi:E3 ubiquitin-protein ligase RNF5 [Drosophila subobscura]|uniref:E3 ubiquitin-protein ligase RNF5 n=1 Tax=Drosophila subobscura TaxID=7241 RepID=UPI00155AA5FC|nr:E3 ubiquitin-protein ligase RNF5 [Drosophila subobscura]
MKPTAGEEQPKAAENIGPLPRQRSSKKLEPYKCCLCAKYLRCGVITICGHFYCWSCLWPQLHDAESPKCCHCLRPLILHEDIVPLHCDGPNDGAGSSLLAQPGNVPRPTGFHFKYANASNWFTFCEPSDSANIPSRSFCRVLGTLRNEHPRTVRVLGILKCIQWLCVGVLCLLWLL